MFGRSGTNLSSFTSTAGGVGGISVSIGRAFRGRLRLRPIRLNFFSALDVVGRTSISRPAEPARFFPKRPPDEVVGLPLSSHGVSRCGVISFTRPPARFDQNDARPIGTFPSTSVPLRWQPCLVIPPNRILHSRTQCYIEVNVQ